MHHAPCTTTVLCHAPSITPPPSAGLHYSSCITHHAPCIMHDPRAVPCSSDRSLFLLEAPCSAGRHALFRWVSCSLDRSLSLYRTPHSLGRHAPLCGVPHSLDHDLSFHGDSLSLVRHLPLREDICSLAHLRSLLGLCAPHILIVVCRSTRPHAFSRTVNLGCRVYSIALCPLAERHDLPRFMYLLIGHCAPSIAPCPFAEDPCFLGRHAPPRGVSCCLDCSLLLHGAPYPLVNRAPCTMQYHRAVPCPVDRALSFSLLLRTTCTPPWSVGYHVHLIAPFPLPDFMLSRAPCTPHRRARFPPRSLLVSLSCTTCPFAGLCALLRASCPSFELPSPPAPMTRLPSPPLKPPPKHDMGAESNAK